jgi:hypothetical protein
MAAAAPCLVNALSFPLRCLPNPIRSFRSFSTATNPYLASPHGLLPPIFRELSSIAASIGSSPMGAIPREIAPCAPLTIPELPLQVSDHRDDKQQRLWDVNPAVKAALGRQKDSLHCNDTRRELNSGRA